MKNKVIAVICLIVMVMCVGSYGLYVYLFPEPGYTDYTVQMQEFFAEYTDLYPYWDVCTVEYPQIMGIDAEVETQVNEMLYDTAMELVNYWHLEPNETVEMLQEQYQVFCSTVDAEASFHSQYLLSAGYAEIYAPFYPIYYVNSTVRALNVDLVTGEVYELEDIIQLSEGFIDVWCKKMAEEYGDSFEKEENKEALLEWFLQTDEEIKDYYFIQPFFYVTEDKELVIGISIDPTIWGLQQGYPVTNDYEALWTVEELEAFKTDSIFWERFDDSETVGEVLECEDLHSNIWLGEEAGVWEYWEKW